MCGVLCAVHAVGVVAATTFLFRFCFWFLLFFILLLCCTVLNDRFFLLISRVSGREYAVLLMHGCKFEDVCACVCKTNKIARKKRNGMKNERRKKCFAR